jgi:hypothetical protein
LHSPKMKWLNAAKGMAFHLLWRDLRACAKWRSIGYSKCGLSQSCTFSFSKSRNLATAPTNQEYLNDGWLGRYLICNAKNTNLQRV